MCARLRDASGDNLFTEFLSRNYKLAPLEPRHRAMLDYVVKVLTDAENIDDEERTALRNVGFSDETIWSITSTACFYAGANRIAQAIGLRPLPEYLEMNRSEGKSARTPH